MHRVGDHRVTFGAGALGLEFRIVDQGGGFITGSVRGGAFVDPVFGSTGPNSHPVFTQQRREALGRALAERNTGGGVVLEVREKH
jgi:hypothetical protein